MRVGIGYDAHRFVEGRPLLLGGVKIPFPHGLAGHSDADVLLHALIDALLGAAGLGDIGAFFPDTDPQWQNADSAELLRIVYGELSGKGYQLVNADTTIIAEEPKLQPYIQQMRERIAEVLKLPVETVSIKGKTNEKMGWLGRGEGIACLTVVMVKQSTGPL